MCLKVLHLSVFSPITKPIGVPDQTTDATLFMLQLVWLEEVKTYTKTR
jgi:hypothetical protein